MPTITVATDQIYAMVGANPNWQLYDPSGYGNDIGSYGGPYKNGVGTHYPLGLTLAQLSHINSALLTVTPGYSYHPGTVRFKIKGQLVASPAQITDLADYMARRGLIPWDGVIDAGLVTVNIITSTDDWTNGVPVVYDITAIVQELVNAFATDTLEIFVDDHDGLSDYLSRNNLSNASVSIDYGAPPVAPTVTTQAATLVTKKTATLNGTVTVIQDTIIVEEGFVYGTTSHVDPGDVPPASAGYDNWASAVGSFGLGPFNAGLTGLPTGTVYYARAYAKNNNGSGHYAYGAEISFNTLAKQTFSLLGWFTGASIGVNQNVGHFQGSYNAQDSVPPSGIVTVPGQLQNVRLQLTDDPVMISTPVTYTLRRSYLDVNHVIQTVDLLHLDFYANERYHEDLITLCTISKDDILSWYVPCAQNGQFSWSADFTPLTDGYFPMSQGHFNGKPPCYYGLLGGFSADVEQAKTTMVHTGQMKYFAAITGWTGGGSDTTDLTLMKNGVSTGVTFHGVPVAQAHNDLYYDDTTVISFVPGDQFWWEATATGGGCPTWAYAGFTFIGMKYEVYLRDRGLPGFNTIPTIAEIEVNNVDIPYTGVGPMLNEVCITPYDVYPNTICLECKIAPGVGKSWTLTLYDNNAPTGLSVTVSGNDTFGIATHPVTWRSGKNAYFILTPSGSPALDYVSAGLLLGPKPPASALGGNAAKLLAAAAI